MHVLPREIDHGRTRVHSKSGMLIFRTQEEKLHIPRSFAVSVLLLLLFETSAWAVDPTHHISQYAHTAWRIQDGVFSGAPKVIAQTADGYLWIGTTSGLMRFDGVRFVPWIPAALALLGP